MARVQRRISRLPERSGVIHGTLADRDSDRLLSDAVIVLHPGARRIVSGARGAVAFDNLANGEYVLITRRIGYVPRTDTMTVRDGNGVEALLPLTST